MCNICDSDLFGNRHRIPCRLTHVSIEPAPELTAKDYGKLRVERADVFKHLRTRQINYNSFESVQRGVYTAFSHWIGKAPHVLNLAMGKVEFARACISYKSQRDAGNLNNYYNIEVFENLTSMKVVHNRTQSKPPPSRTDKPILGFTKRSRNNVLNKFRMMRRKVGNVDLALPLFCTLTYGVNYKDSKRSKSHLNAFHQRLRRLLGDDYRYFWRLEFQGEKSRDSTRQAIHYHLAIYSNELAEYTKCEFKLWLFRKFISQIWAEITIDVDYKTWVNPETGTIERRINESHLRAGTNVKIVDNWRMAAGYMAKYVAKEERIPIDKETGEYMNPGRYWGFSRNFDFSAYYAGCVDVSHLSKLQQFADVANDAALDHYNEHARQSIKRYTRLNKPHKIEYIKTGMQRQKSRWMINRFKIFNARIQYERMLSGAFDRDFEGARAWYEKVLSVHESRNDKDFEGLPEIYSNLAFEVDYKAILSSVTVLDGVVQSPALYYAIGSENIINGHVKNMAQFYAN